MGPLLIAAGLVLALSGAAVLAAFVEARRRLGARNSALRAVSGELRGRPEAVGTVLELAAGDLVPGDAQVEDGHAVVRDLPFPGPHLVRERGGERSAVTGGARIVEGRLRVRLLSSGPGSIVARAAAVTAPSAVPPLVGFAGVVLLAAGAAAGVPPLAAVLAVLGVLLAGWPLRRLGFVLGLADLAEGGLLARHPDVAPAIAGVEVVLMDKNGTLTHGQRRAQSLVAVAGTDVTALARAVALSGLADETPEGLSSIELVVREHGSPAAVAPDGGWSAVPFTPQARISGVDLDDGTELRKGSRAAMREWSAARGLDWPAGLDDLLDEYEADAMTALVVGDSRAGLLGAVAFGAPVRARAAAGIAEVRSLGVEVVLLTGDSPVVARQLARLVGVGDVVAEADPEAKVAAVAAWRSRSAVVAMVGDGDNDAPALAAADLGIAPYSGLPGAKAVADVVDLDSDPGKLGWAITLMRARAAVAGSLVTSARIAVGLAVLGAAGTALTGCAVLAAAAAAAVLAVATARVVSRTGGPSPHPSRPPSSTREALWPLR
ncbi:HAD-IC family P-type ATPase [Amycolatopsis sp. PS_44_ISF1]|uniref:HAD-IC family P-type ATPase n=1 Tax=Amycolatopsis sp. PS_44_ISF1 TaxID=2974917 RepID=UPI0028DDBEF2|nr:HAD-IC family P-type ATPase [Amycolatopsis sp. PS_44_ISF1]MDT8913510.1 HAD-IC family P-type ATPase [Amycolatopsis sp. PS_44_ISF1]